MALPIIPEFIGDLVFDYFEKDSVYTKSFLKSTYKFKI